MAKYWVCEYCCSNLDFGETCDCCDWEDGEDTDVCVGGVTNDCEIESSMYEVSGSGQPIPPAAVQMRQRESGIPANL